MREATKLVHNPGLYNIEYLLRVNVTALRASTRRLVGSVHNILEVVHRLQRVSIIDLESTHIENDQRVEHLEDIRRRLVDHHEDHLATKRQLLQQVHDVFRISRRKSRRRFIHKQDRGLTQQLQGYVETLSLTT